MGFIKKHPALSAFITFVVITLPQTIDSYVNLYEKLQVADMHVDWYSWILPILPIVGVILLGIVVWQTRKAKPQAETHETNSKFTAKSSMLEQVLEDDRKNLGSRLHQYREKWFFDNIDATEPFMEVIIQIVNASIFPIVIKGVEGSFEIQGTKCNFDATMSSSRIPRGEFGNIRISQRLSEKTVEKMVKLNNDRGGFMVDLNACHLVIQAEEPGVENKLVRVSLRIREQTKL